jgi:phosphoribosylglycinamide formyltransferase-1
MVIFHKITMQKIKTAILISGRGSNMQALVNAAKNPNYPAEIVLVISNKETAAGLEFAKQNGIKTAVINHKDFITRQDFDQAMAKIIDANNCQIVCLAGFMRLLSGWFVKHFENRLINIHPSLLPNFKGDKAVADALNAGVKQSGCTVHFVTEEMDSGEIIKQSVVEVLKDDTIETLAARILKQEHIIYPESLAIICNNLSK